MEGFILASTFVLGVLFHAFYLNHGEHHMQGVMYAKMVSLGLVACTFLLVRFDWTLGQASLTTLTFATIFMLGSGASTLVDRVIVSPVNKFPGPFGAKLTSLYLASGTSEPAFRKLTKLHEQYGDFVRVGSSDISTIDPEAVEALFGTHSPCRKSSWYDLVLPIDSLHSRRDLKAHNQLRRIWSPAFSDKALKGYEMRIRPLRNKLLACLDEFGGQPVDANKWLGLYSFDVMADMSFGKSFGMLESKEQHWAVQTIHTGMTIHKLHLPIWLFRCMAAIPGATAEFWKMSNYCRKLVVERRANPAAVSDVMSYLLAPYEDKKELSKADLDLLNGESNLIVVAGSDTTALTLTSAMMLLAENPDQAIKLRKELEQHVPESLDDEILHTQIMNLDHLNGVIWETLRFYPAVPSYPSRLTPPEGCMIGKTYVPGNTTVLNPSWIMGRREEFYERAQDFVPERWYEKKDMVKNKAAWAPFSIGTYSCIGRPLALQNVRITLARLVMRYDISFAPSDKRNDRKSFEDAMYETFTLAPPGLNLCLKKRG